MVSGPAQVFTRYENGVTHTRSHLNLAESKMTKKKNISYDANFLYLFCSDGAIPCSKNMPIVHENPFNQK